MYFLKEIWMLPDRTDKFSRIPFFEAWEKNSLFMSVLAPPPFLVKEFGNEWIEKVRAKLGETIMSLFYLYNLSEWIETIHNLKGFDRIKTKLEKADDSFFPTVSEVIFLDMIADKIEETNIYLEKSFSTKRFTYPEVKIVLERGLDIYFEVTQISNFKEMEEIIYYYSTFYFFILSLKILDNIERKLVFNFKEYPDTNILTRIYKGFNSPKIFDAIRGKDNFTISDGVKNEFEIIVTDGFDVIFNVPDKYIEDKIKDKIESKTRQFDPEGNNFLVLDATILACNPQRIAGYISDYFQWSGNTVIKGVIILRNLWVFDIPFPRYGTVLHYRTNPNFSDGKYDSILFKIFPQ